MQLFTGYVLLLVAVISFSTSLEYSLPNGIIQPSLLAKWEFDDASQDMHEWRGGAETARNVAVAPNGAGFIQGTLLSGTTPNRTAWLQTYPIDLLTIDTTHIIIRMRHRVAADYVGIQIRMSPVVDEFDWPASTYIQHVVAAASTPDWTRYTFPITEIREHVPSSTLRIYQIRLLPALKKSGNGYDSVNVGTFDLDFVHIIHAPSIVKVVGCMDTTYCPGEDGCPAEFSTSFAPPNKQYYRIGSANMHFKNSSTFDAGVSYSNDDSLPFARTYGCHINGGDRINITGFHFGEKALVTIDGKPCINTTQVGEEFISCILPAANQAASYDAQMVAVSVINTAAPSLTDTEMSVSYGFHTSRINITITNINSMAFDVNVLHGSYWTSIVTTGYRVFYTTQNIAACRAGTSAACHHVEFANVSVLSIVSLLPGQQYYVQVCAINDGVSHIRTWRGEDRYYRKASQPDSHMIVCSDVVTAQTLFFDFSFPVFSAAAIKDVGPAVNMASVNTLEWAGGEGHYGLSLVGTASIANCNATHSCCDGYGGPDYVEQVLAFTSKLGLPPYGEYHIFPYNDHRFDYNHSNIVEEVQYVRALLKTMQRSSFDRSILWGLIQRRVYKLKTRLFAWDGIDEMGLLEHVNPSVIQELEEEGRASLQAPLNFSSVPTFMKQVYERNTFKPPAYYTSDTGRVYFPYTGDALSFCQDACFRSSEEGPVTNLNPFRSIPSASDEWRVTISTQLNAATGYSISNASQYFSRHVITGRANLTYGAFAGSSNGVRISSLANANPLPTAPCGPALRITPSLASQAGAAWYPRAQQVDEGFDTTFAFRLSNPSLSCVGSDVNNPNCRTRGGAGFAFVVSTRGENQLGDGGTEGLGYSNLPDSLAVEFDTYYNKDQDDLWENHVSVHFQGVQNASSAHHSSSLGHVDVANDLANGIHVARIVYSPVWRASVMDHPSFVPDGNAFISTLMSPLWKGGFGFLRVYIDDPQEPVLTVPLNLSSSLGGITEQNGRAWVGFTAATGVDVWQTHDILSWHFTQLRLSNVD